jgi:hypothetical protein
MAVERMRVCDDVGELARELGVTRRCLYKWRTKLEIIEPGEESARPSTHGASQRKQIRTTGWTFELSNKFDNAWLNSTNQYYLMSDDANFNPMGNLSGNWTQLQVDKGSTPKPCDVVTR